MSRNWLGAKKVVVVQISATDSRSWQPLMTVASVVGIAAGICLVPRSFSGNTNGTPEVLLSHLGWWS
jgi:hypothetical protein